MTVITSVTGDITAKISLEADFYKPGFLQIFKDLHGYYHFSGTENHEEPDNSRIIYFVMKPDVANGNHVYPAGIHEVLFFDYKDDTRIDATITKGECTVNFDHQKQHFAMSFHAILKNKVDDREIDILGSFDLTQSSTRKAQ
ncbi:hypothetical protein [Pseudomonas sp. LB3P25]